MFPKGGKTKLRLNSECYLLFKIYGKKTSKSQNLNQSTRVVKLGKIWKITFAKISSFPSTGHCTGARRLYVSYATSTFSGMVMHKWKAPTPHSTHSITYKVNCTSTLSSMWTQVSNCKCSLKLHHVFITHQRIFRANCGIQGFIFYPET